MKVLHINKSDAGGGAAIAAQRIHRALRANGTDSMFLTLTKQSSDTHTFPVGEGAIHKLKSDFHFIAERLLFLKDEKDPSLRYAFSPASTGFDISNHPLVKEADILHLHWINQGFLSLKSMEKLFKLGKPIVWTLHDMWAFTGGCHYSGSCIEYMEHCGYCPFLRKPDKHDLSNQIFLRKKDIYSNSNMNMVACSKWLRTLSSESSLFRGKDVKTIPNPINTDQFTKLDQLQCRRELGLPEDKKLVLFGAANLLDARKGFRYLIEALSIVRENFPALSQRIELVVFGKLGENISKQLPFKIHNMNFITDHDRLVKIYNATDLFLLPSLQDNLPNTVMESMACHTPVVGFRIGGVPEMVIHEKTGFLAEAKNSLSLATGLYQTLFFNDPVVMGNNARNRAMELYSEKVVAPQYKEVYEKALRNKK